ncbi:aminoglycoside N3'-acetyltransferase [Neobacillus niacini]|nr:aminoglycoside N3'-acetyltransferase [Neobacillus niacini]
MDKLRVGRILVLDVLTEYMKNGLLVFLLIHGRANNPRFYVNDSPSCVGLLTELFRKRPSIVRSWYPTHSVAALGKEAHEFIVGNNNSIRLVHANRVGGNYSIGMQPSC